MNNKKQEANLIPALNVNEQEVRWTRRALTVLEKTSTMWFPYPKGEAMLQEILSSKPQAPTVHSVAIQTILSKPTSQRKNELIRV